MMYKWFFAYKYEIGLQGFNAEVVIHLNAKRMTHEHLERARGLMKEEHASEDIVITFFSRLEKVDDLKKERK